MPTVTVRTDLRCSACVAGIAPLLDAAPGVESWSADVAAPGKPLTVTGSATAADVDALLRQKGYHVLGEVTPAHAPPPAEPPQSYYPLALVVGFLVAATLLAEAGAGHWDAMRAMRHFMAGFFLVFSFFKLLDLRAFADAYAGYDVLAARWPGWGYVYPFVEAGLGAAYLAGVWPTAVSWVTLAVMLLGTAGVARTLLARRKIRCACLGTGFNLPMSTVTLVEDLGMAGMAAVMLFVGPGH
jgi:hypothetical protein